MEEMPAALGFVLKGVGAARLQETVGRVEGAWRRILGDEGRAGGCSKGAGVMERCLGAKKGY